MRYGFSKRTDTGSQQLVKVARKLGFTVIPVNGDIDAILVKGGTVHLVDWKHGPNAKKTQKQKTLDAQGVPIWYVHSIEQLLAMVNRGNPL